MHALIELISNFWFWLSVFFSVIGALVLFVGHKIGHDAEKLFPPPESKNDIFEDILKRYKVRVNLGHRIVMFGAVIEAACALAVCVIAGLENVGLRDDAARAQKQADQLQLEIIQATNNIVANSPLNQPLSDLEAEAVVYLSPDFIMPTNIEHPESTVFNLIEKHEEIPTVGLERFRNLYPYEVIPFVAKEIEPENGYFISSEVPAFHFRFTMDFVNTLSLPPAHLTPKDILENYPLIRICIAGVPTNALLLGGFARITINGTFSKQWLIPEQKCDMRFVVTNNWPFTLIATNYDSKAIP